MRKELLVVVLALFVALPGVAQEKRRVAVLDFGYGTVLTRFRRLRVEPGCRKGISELLINQLVNRRQLSCDQ